KHPAEIVEQAPPPPVANKKVSGNQKALMRDQGKLEQQMLDLQTRKHGLEARLATSLPPQEIGELGTQLSQVDAELAVLEEKWLAISEQIDTAS
ncbi:MAG: ATP-binding cassette, subfamily er 3, partial [Pseudomonadota bacterium]|nr:ATP-binding cassette, subfamily er 3 [Pseudomonadota bacterium]